MATLTQAAVMMSEIGHRALACRHHPAVGVKGLTLHRGLSAIACVRCMSKLCRLPQFGRLDFHHELFAVGTCGC